MKRPTNRMSAVHGAMFIAMAACTGGFALAGDESQASAPPKATPAEDAPAPEGPKIDGQVLNHLGGGIEDATVTVVLERSVKSAGPLVAKTEDFGDFSIALPAEAVGTAVVTIEKAGHKKFTREVEIDPARAHPFVDVVLEGDTNVEGVVRRQQDGNPIAGARVVVTDGYQDFDTTTDADGAFDIKDLSPGGVEVKVEADGFGNWSRPLAEAERGSPLTVELGPEWIAAIRVVGPKGVPVQDAVVEAMLNGVDGWRDGVTDGAGEIQFRGLSPEVEALQVRVDHPNFARMTGFDVTVKRPGGGGTVERTIELIAGAQLKGSVVDNENGRPIEMARITVGASLDNGAMEWSDFEGNFKVGGVPPGKHVVTVHAADWAPAVKAVNVLPDANDPVEFRLKPGVTLHGSVVNEDGEPVPQAVVSINEWETFTTVGLRAMSGPDGAFEIAHTPEGSMTLGAFAQGFEPLEVSIDTESNAPLLLKLQKQPEPKPSLAIGATVPEMTLTTTDGKEIRLGPGDKYMLLDFWATWCGPCVGEVPNVKQVQKEMGGRDDFTLVSISLDRDMKALASFVEKQGMTWPQVSKEGGAEKAADAFGVRSIPSTFLIAPDGKIVGKDLRGPLMAASVKALIPKQ